MGWKMAADDDIFADAMDMSEAYLRTGLARDGDGRCRMLAVDN